MMPNLYLQVQAPEGWSTLNTEMFSDEEGFIDAHLSLQSKQNGWALDTHYFPNSMFRIISEKRLNEEKERAQR